MTEVQTGHSYFGFGFQVNDLLRRKDSNHLGDIGVTEVNKNVDVWSGMDQLNQTSSNRYTHTVHTYT